MRIFKISFIILAIIVYSQNINAQCTNCDGEFKWNNEVNSSSIGFNTQARGFASFSSGSTSTAFGIATTTLGYYNYAAGDYSLILGSFLQTHENASNSIVIGEGYSENYQLINNQAHSLMIGFSSKRPTLFVSISRNIGNHDGTGKVAIGNVINQAGYMAPQAKLHLRADDGEEAAVFIEPNNWSANEEAGLALGNLFHGITH